MSLLLLTFGVLAIAASTAFYFLPAIIAAARLARHFAGIFLVNLLFGWTVIGWFGTLLWACTDEPQQATSRVPCPFCAEAILPAAKVCPHCRRDLPESFTASQGGGRRDYLPPIVKGSPISLLIVLLIFIILVMSALYYRHVRFERNAPTFVSASPMVVADQYVPNAR